MQINYSKVFNKQHDLLCQGMIYGWIIQYYLILLSTNVWLYNSKFIHLLAKSNLMHLY